MGRKTQERDWDVYTDGSYQMSKDIGGWSAVFTHQGEYIKNRRGNIKKSTNNRAEMLGVIYALRNIDKGTIFTDSIYCVSGYNSWMHKWRKNNWKRGKKPIKNQDLWKQIYDLYTPKKKLKWVRGHNGNEFNELADELARFKKEDGF